HALHPGGDGAEHPDPERSAHRVLLIDHSSTSWRFMGMTPTITPTITDFDYRRVPVGDVALNVAVGGAGSPVVLLHGFPQTHLMWRHVAADLAREHTVIVPDLRGYGASDKPAETGPDTYSKRTMAVDVVADRKSTRLNSSHVKISYAV